MSVKNFILGLVSLLLLSSCVHKSEKSKSQQLFISKSSPNLSINLIEGTKIEKQNYWELNFKPIKGGGSYLFGKMVNGVIPDDYPRLEIFKKEKIIAKYSINEISKLNTKFISGSIKVFIIPEFN